MSAIPPAWLSGILQAHAAQQNAEKERQTEAAAEAERNRASAFKESLRDAIRSVDEEDRIYEDAEGTGSQGRPSDQPDDQEPPERNEPADESTGHIDLEA